MEFSQLVDPIRQAYDGLSSFNITNAIKAAKGNDADGDGSIAIRDHSKHASGLDRGKQ
jgi:hypothetical protein